LNGPGVLSLSVHPIIFVNSLWLNHCPAIAITLHIDEPVFRASGFHEGGRGSVPGGLHTSFRRLHEITKALKMRAFWFYVK
jgi:hypothetical protein